MQRPPGSGPCWLPCPVTSNSAASKTMRGTSSSSLRPWDCYRRKVLMLKIICASCGEHIWHWDKPDPPTKADLMPLKAEYFTGGGGPYPPPVPLCRIDTSCPSCGKMPFQPVSGMRCGIVTDQGVFPERREEAG